MKRRIAGFAALMSVAGGSALAQPAPTTTPPPSATQATNESAVHIVKIDEGFIANFAKQHGISVRDAGDAFADTKALSDFALLNADNPNYGDLSATYTGGKYRVKLRRPKASLDADDAQLRKTLKGQLTVVRTGSSNRELKDQILSARTELGEYVDRVRIAITDDGELAITAEPSDIEQVRTRIKQSVRIESGSVERPRVLAAPNDRIEYRNSATSQNWSGTCTVGYAVRRLSDNWPGLVTAGHCNNANWTSPNQWMARIFGKNEYFWAAENEICGSSDSQLHPITYSAQQAAGNIYAVAGGLYYGQPVLRLGSNTSSSTGVVEPGSWTNNPVAAGGDCGAQSVNGFRISSNESPKPVPGDSGGPVMLAYGGNWYLAGITSAGGATSQTVVSGIFGSTTPSQHPSWRICTQTAPC